MRSAGKKTLCVLAALICAASVARGQSNEALRFQRNLEQIQRDTLTQINPEIPLDQRLTLDYGMYISYAYTSFTDNNDDNTGFRQTDLYAFGRMNIDGAHEFFVRYRGSYRDFNEGDTLGPDSSGWWYTNVDRAYYRFDLQKSEAAYQGKVTENNLIAEIGRDFVYWANGLVMAQTVDGGQIHGKYKWLNLDVVAGATPRNTIDFDPTRPSYEDNTHRNFYGGMVTVDVDTHHPFVYAMYQQDNNHDWLLQTGPIETQFDYNSLYIGFGSNGNVGDHWLYGAEVAYETGTGLSNSFDQVGSFIVPVEQTEDDIDAWAGDFRIDYLFNDIRRTRASGEVIFATGSDDRLNTTNTFGGNKPNKVDTAFNAFGALNTGLAFAPTVSNIIVGRTGISAFPLPGSNSLGRLQTGLDLFIFYKFDADAPIDEPSAVGVGYLGWETDLSVNWQLTSDVTLAGRYGLFFPNEEALGSDQIRQFLYLGVTYAF